MEINERNRREIDRWGMGASSQMVTGHNRLKMIKSRPTSSTYIVLIGMTADYKIDDRGLLDCGDLSQGYSTNPFLMKFVHSEMNVNQIKIKSEVTLDL